MELHSSCVLSLSYGKSSALDVSGHSDPEIATPIVTDSNRLYFHNFMKTLGTEMYKYYGRWNRKAEGL
jgi:hypothetical protein